MQKLFTFVAALTLCASVACGQSEAEKQIEATEKAVKAAEEATKEAVKAAEKAQQQAANNVATGMSEVAKALSSLGATTPDGKPVPAVSAETLATSLPQMSGWEMATPDNETITTPFPITQTETTYKKGDSEIEVKVVDAASAQMLLLPWSMMMTAGYSKESSDGYEKAVSVGGNPGFEKWNRTRKRGELNVLVNKRFMVTVEGDNLADTKLLHEFAAKVNAGALK